MAKNEVKTRIQVSSANTVEEVLALEEKGATMVFDYEEGFLPLPDAVVDKLGHDNQRQYFISVGAHKAFEKQQAGARPTRGLTILDPLGGSAGNKLKILQRQADGKLHDVTYGWTDAEGRKWHPCWKRPDEIAEVEGMGYIRVTNETDTDLVCRGASSTTSSKVILKKDGTDDLILFKISQRIFDEHMYAVALKSTERAGATMKDLKAQLKEISRRIDVEDTSGEVEATITASGEHVVGE